VKDLEFDVFEAVCGVQGETDNDPRWARGCCHAVSPRVLWLNDKDDKRHRIPCTRPFGHRGDHVAAHVNGGVLDRWPAHLEPVHAQHN
jgi:hypothetical protein